MNREKKHLPNITEQIPAEYHGRCNFELVFTNLKTKAWHRIRMLAQRQATVFAYSADKSAAYVGFEITQKNATKVASFYAQIYNWKTVFVRIQGTNIETMKEIEPWAHCWIQSYASTDKNEHCKLNNYEPEIHAGIVSYKKYISSEPRATETILTLPCKCVRWRPNVELPGKYKQQYEDAAAKSGCVHCPLFDMKKFNCKKRIRTADEIEMDKILVLKGSEFLIDIPALLAKIIDEQEKK